MFRRRPYACCVICSKSHEESGGICLVATPSHAIRVCAPGVPLGGVLTRRTLRLTGDFRDVIVVMSGQQLWTDQVVRRVETACYAGDRPWFCQRCASSSLCPRCGTPLTAAPMTDGMEDDGHVVHSAAFTGFVRQCSNPECDARRIRSCREGRCRLGRRHPVPPSRLVILVLASRWPDHSGRAALFNR